MQKLKDFILSINFNMLVFTLLGIRIAVFGASIGDALTILAVCGLQGFIKYIETKTQIDINEQLRKELDDMKSSIGGLVLKNSIRPPSNPQNDPSLRKFF